MEPDSAFGLACNVFTVVDFLVKVVAKSREMYRNGAAAKVESLTAIIGDLEKSNAQLSKSIEEDAGRNTGGNEMQTLCDDCNKQATRLLVKKNRLQGEKELTLKNVPKAMKLVWKKDELEATVRLLESYQARINTRLLIEMRAFDQKFDQQLTDILRTVVQDRGNMLTVPVFERQMELLSQELNRIYDFVSKNSHGGTGASSHALNGHMHTSTSLQDFPKTYEAFEQGKIDLLRRLLEENPSWVRYRDAYGQIPLHMGAGQGDSKLTNFLMRRGAALNAEDNHLRAPLHYATMMNSTALVRSLLAAGASGSVEAEDGQPPRLLRATQLGNQLASSLGHHHRKPQHPRPHRTLRVCSPEQNTRASSRCCWRAALTSTTRKKTTSWPSARRPATGKSPPSRRCSSAARICACATSLASRLYSSPLRKVTCPLLSCFCVGMLMAC